MTKILFVNPNKWGRGITTIWLASHIAISKSKNCKVKLFDCTFYKNWTDSELVFNTENKQYKKTNYFEKVKFNDNDIYEDFQNEVNKFNPDLIFWSAFSAHIHGEGEYVNLQYGYELIQKTSHNALLITGGIQGTASIDYLFEAYPKIDLFISGDSELVLKEVLENFDSNETLINNKEKLKKIDGISYLSLNSKKPISNKRQKMISNLDEIPFYDYSEFDEKVFYRPYNGKVIKAIDYELSRGCIYSCSYCVETVIQKYYGFKKKTKNGAILNSNKFLRSKSAQRIYDELSYYKLKYGIELVRSQDTNFLTIDRKVLLELERLILDKPLNLKIYIETRPEGINEKTVKILKNLGVDGVGMGIELSSDEFRENNLNRFASQNKIINAFKILEKNHIKRTSYNIIGLPDQDENSILDTIKFNKKLKPDNVTVAFFSPFLGTMEEEKIHTQYKDIRNKKNLDPQLRYISKNSKISLEKLIFYKKNFTSMVFEN